MPAVDRDEILFEILEQLLEEARAGRPVDLDAAARQHPELADELRSLWATMLVAEDLGSTVARADEPWPVRLELSADLPRDPDFGDYELLEELGRGGMGVVYRARQQTLNRVVALKMILRGDLASPDDVARFRAEAEAAARLQHPHIVPVYEVGEHRGRPYFSMQLVEGVTLAQRLAEGPLPAQQSAEILLPVCRAIAEAHRHGVLHRDLKPSNILIDRSGRSFVTDFGLAKRIDTAGGGESLTNSGAILGTPGYMAPEQAAGQRGVVGPVSDVYSLGAILYAMLTGRPPFQAATPVDTLLLVLEQEPLPPRMLNPRADADLEMIALKCLQKPADLRYVSADALADDLRAFLQNEPIAARSSQFSQIITRAFRETHHASILENWGLLWMWHSAVVFALCLITNTMQWSDIASRWPYVALWSLGVGTWAAIFWELRRRSGPITFVERQIAHIWAGSTIASTLLFGLEWALDLPVLTLSAVLPLIAGQTFLVKAGILSGKFYIQSAALFATSFVMALLHAHPTYDISITLFGFVLGLCFFLPGLKYYRQRRLGRSV